MLTPLLSASKISRRIEHRWVWQHLNFELFPGESLAIVGPSGSGKSLLLRSIAGLDALESGQLIFQGRPLSDLSMPQYRSQVVYLHQRPALSEGTVEYSLQQVYRLAAHRHKVYSQTQILQSLASLGRGVDFLKQSVENLSGGEAQIVACLRALQLKPQVLLLDEPTASMDEATTEHIETLITQWQQADSSRSCIWTSHNTKQLQRVTDRQLILKGES